MHCGSQDGSNNKSESFPDDYENNNNTSDNESMSEAKLSGKMGHPRENYRDTRSERDKEIEEEHLRKEKLRKEQNILLKQEQQRIKPLLMVHKPSVPQIGNNTVPIPWVTGEHSYSLEGKFTRLNAKYVK
jgi:hypothetical protein